MQLPVFLRGYPVFFLKQGIKVRAVCEFQSGSYGADGFRCLRQALGRLFQAESHTVIKETHIGELVDDTVQIIAAVMKPLFHLRARHAAVAFLKESGDA